MILNDGIVLKTFLPATDSKTSEDDGCCCSIKEIAVNDAVEIWEDETASTFNVASSTDGDNNVVAAAADDDVNNDDFEFLVRVVVVDVGFIVGFLCNIMVSASFKRFGKETAKAEAANVGFVFLVVAIVDNDDNDFLLLLFFINSDIIEYKRAFVFSLVVVLCFYCCYFRRFYAFSNVISF